MDELMRHQPSLKSDATAAIIKLLNDLCQKGSDPKYICWRPHSKSETSPINIVRSSSNAEGTLQLKLNFYFYYGYILLRFF